MIFEGELSSHPHLNRLDFKSKQLFSDWSAAFKILRDREVDGLADISLTIVRRHAEIRFLARNLILKSAMRVPDEKVTTSSTIESKMDSLSSLSQYSLKGNNSDETLNIL